jgi:hypothetical protein
VKKLIAGVAVLALSLGTAGGAKGDFMGAADGPPFGLTLSQVEQDLLILANGAAATGNTTLAQTLLTDWFDLWWLGMLLDHH